MAAQWRTSSCQSCGQPRSTTASRGSPKGKSKAPSQAPGRASTASKLVQSEQRSM